MDKNIPLVFETGFVRNQDIWVSARNFNGLFKCSILTGKCEFIGYFPNVDIIGRRLHYADIIENKNKLYFFPLNNKYIHILDLCSHKISSLDVGLGDNVGFSQSFRWKNEVFLVSTRNESIWKFDLDSYKFIKIFEGSKKGGHVLGYYILERYVYITTTDSNVMHRLDRETKEIEKLIIGDSSDSYLIVAGMNSLIYLSSRTKPEVIFFDVFDHTIKYIRRFDKRIMLNSWKNKKMVLCNSTRGSGIIKLNLDKFEMNTCSFEKEEIYDSIFEIQYAFSYQDDIYYVLEADKYVYSLNKETKLFQFSLEKSFIKKYQKSLVPYYQKSCISPIKENELFGLEEYIKIVENGYSR